MARDRQDEPAAADHAALDLNAASREELEAIEGIGGHAYEIVRTREERGGFTDLRQLEEVPGFAGKVTDEIRRRLTVAGKA